MTQIKVSRGNYTVYDTILKSAGVYNIDANLDFNANDITDLDDILFFDGASILSSSTGLILDVPTGDAFNIKVNNIDEITINSFLITLQETVDMLGDLDMNSNNITNGSDGIVRIGNDSTHARLRLTGFYGLTPADPPVNQTDIMVVNSGTSRVLRIRYNDAGVMRVGDVALV